MNIKAGSCWSLPARRSHALLKISKAQFGVAVYLNGQKVLEALGADSFDVSVRSPSRPGNYTLTATATTTAIKGGAAADPTVSRRWVVIKPEALAVRGESAK